MLRRAAQSRTRQVRQCERTSRASSQHRTPASFCAGRLPELPQGSHASTPSPNNGAALGSTGTHLRECGELRLGGGGIKQALVHAIALRSPPGVRVQLRHRGATAWKVKSAWNESRKVPQLVGSSPGHKVHTLNFCRYEHGWHRILVHSPAALLQPVTKHPRQADSLPTCRAAAAACGPAARSPGAAGR